MPSTLTLRLPPVKAEDSEAIKAAAAKALNLHPRRINAFQVLRRSIDARKRDVRIQLSVSVFVEEPFQDAFTFAHTLQDVRQAPEVLIAGAGPAGLFAALRLIELGLRPVLIERGKDVRSRRRDLAAMNKEGIVNPESNYCFGEGGAGTYSDGKLYTRSSKRGDLRRCLQWFHYFGATERILQDAHPHIGTNKLPGIITRMRETIETYGGELRFESKLTDLILEGGQLRGIELNGSERLLIPRLILATGHSARDVFELLHRKRVPIQAKSFALGVRVEHPQDLIDRIQYHCPPQADRPEGLPPAAYSLVSQSIGRGVFSFCMCPGGIIAPASTEPGALVVNGWSPSKRDNPYANSGMVVTVDEADFFKAGFEGPLAAMRYQQLVEENAWNAGGGALVAPAQRLTDFVKNRLSPDLPDCSYLPGVQSARLSTVLPEAVNDALVAGFKHFGKKMKGYLTPEAIVVATESRTSSPVRVPRLADTLEHPQIKGLFPCGEGAGYAGGIISAAMDGITVAEAVHKRHKL